MSGFIVFLNKVKIEEDERGGEVEDHGRGGRHVEPGSDLWRREGRGGIPH